MPCLSKIKAFFHAYMKKTLCCKIRIKEYLKATGTKNIISEISSNTLRRSSASVNKRRLICIFSKKLHRRHPP